MLDKKIKIQQEKITNRTARKIIKGNNTIMNMYIDKVLKQMSTLDRNDFILNLEKRKNEILLDGMEFVEDMIKLEQGYTLDNTYEVSNMVNRIVYTGLGQSISNLDDEFIVKFVTRKIDGKNFSDRLWKHKEKLVLDINDELTNYIINKDITLKQLSNKLADKHNSSQYKTYRLLKNEASQIENDLKLKLYRENDSVQLLIRETMEDDRVSELCQSEQGDIWHKDDINMPSLPRHINCRCYYRMLVEDKYSFIK